MTRPTATSSGPWIASVARLDHRPWVAVAVAMLLVALALAVRIAINPWMPAGYPFITFFPAVVIASFLGGWRIGIVAAVVSGLASWYFFIPPVGAFSVADGVLTALISFTVVTATEIVLIWALERAVAQARSAEQTARELAASRELLFHELQHRVSNNLQFVSALLGLEARRLEDGTARKALKDAGARMALVGRIQRTLHDPSSQSIDFQTLARNVVTDTLGVAGADHITFTVGGEGQFTPEQAPPLALVLLESVNNAIEHAFEGRSAGHLAIALAKQGQETVLTVRDDGIGLSPGETSTDSLGLSLVNRLAAQLGGRYALEAGETGGTVATLSFRTLD